MKLPSNYGKWSQVIMGSLLSGKYGKPLVRKQTVLTAAVIWYHNNQTKSKQYFVQISQISRFLCLRFRFEFWDSLCSSSLPLADCPAIFFVFVCWYIRNIRNTNKLSWAINYGARAPCTESDGNNNSGERSNLLLKFTQIRITLPLEMRLTTEYRRQLLKIRNPPCLHLNKKDRSDLTAT